jgi:formate dehydrogenase subunit gamma
MRARGRAVEGGGARGPRLPRFGKTTRWLHWSFAVCFLALATTGGILAARRPLALEGGLVESLGDVHRVFAACLLLVPALVFLSGATGATARDLAQVLRWSRDDLRWLALQPRAVLGRAALPPAGKLNAGQKLNSLIMAGITAGLIGSGALLWTRPGALVPWLIHITLFLVWLPVFAGHLFLALVNPGTRPALRGMLLGEVDRAWAEHHHGAWVREVESGAEAGAAATSRTARPAPAAQRSPAPAPAAPAAIVDESR